MWGAKVDGFAEGEFELLPGRDVCFIHTRAILVQGVGHWRSHPQNSENLFWGSQNHG
jgi:hypothetical protein